MREEESERGERRLEGAVAGEMVYQEMMSSEPRLAFFNLVLPLSGVPVTPANIN